MLYNYESRIRPGIERLRVLLDGVAAACEVGDSANDALGALHGLFDLAATLRKVEEAIRDAKDRADQD